MEKGNQLYEGKAKKVYQTDVPGQLIVEYKDASPVTSYPCASSSARRYFPTNPSLPVINAFKSLSP